MSRPRITRTRTSARLIRRRRGRRASDASPQLLRLLHLASPALPIGAFHFSQGLEYAVECGWVNDEASALEWIGGIAGASLATLDLPVLDAPAVPRGGRMTTQACSALERVPDRLPRNRRTASRGSAPGQRIAARAGRARAHDRAVFRVNAANTRRRVACHGIRVRLRALGHRAHGVLADLCLGVGGEPGAGGRETGAAGAECRAENAACALRAHPSFGRARTQTHRFRHRDLHCIERGGERKARNAVLATVQVLIGGRDWPDAALD